MEDFTNNLKTKLKDKGLSENSIKLYLRNLEKLNDNKKIDNFKFLKDTKKIVDQINKYKDNTKRSIFISIVSVLKCCPEDKKLKKLHDEYYNMMINKSDEIKNKATDEATEEQKENWIKWDEVKAKFDELEKEVDALKDNKKISESEYNKLLSYMILGLYVHNQPRRNKDYQLMNVVKKYNDKYENDINYLSYDENKFVFNNYKTAKKFGRQVIDYNDDLKKVIDLYLKFHPKILGKKLTRNTNEHFLVNYKGEPLSQVNSITKILNKIFGKRLGSSALRHIFLSDKYKDVVSEMKDDADKMGHSTQTQREYIKNVV